MYVKFSCLWKFLSHLTLSCYLKHWFNPYTTNTLELWVKWLSRENPRKMTIDFASCYNFLYLVWSLHFAVKLTFEDYFGHAWNLIKLRVKDKYLASLPDTIHIYSILSFTLTLFSPLHVLSTSFQTNELNKVSSSHETLFSSFVCSFVHKTFFKDC